MATVAKAAPSLLPSTGFAHTPNRSWSTSYGSPRCLRAGLSHNVRQLRLGGGAKVACGSSFLRASAVSSPSSSFQGRLCLVFTSPTGEAREGKRTGVEASLLGVGAPEALVIGVVALLVFGPKGLAEVARTLGKSLRAFQPTIKELQEVSRDFKATLEQEIGLDELRNPSSYESPPTSTQSRPFSVSSTPSSIFATEAPPAAPNQAAEGAAWGGAPPAEPVVEASSSTGQAQPSSVKSFFNEASGAEQVGSPPTESLEISDDNGIPKP